jgi:putative ABC transport system substrate-binding protein
MNRYFFPTIILLTILIGAFVFLPRRNVSKKNIAVLFAHGFSAHENAYAGIAKAVATVQANGTPVEMKIYWFNVLDKIQLAAVCEAALTDCPDCLIVGGGTATQVLHELIQKRKQSIPALFVAVNNPVELGILKSLECPGGCMTGVVTVPLDSFEMPKICRLIKPEARRIVLPCDISNDPDGHVQQHALAAKEYFEACGLVLDVLLLNGLADALRTIKSVLPAYDTLIGLELDSTIQLSSGIAKLCDEIGVTYFCGAFDGIAAGATVTYATNTAYLGMCAVDMAMEILFKGKNPAIMPVRSIANTREIYINTVAARRQGYSPDSAQIKANLAATPGMAWLVERLKLLV